MIPPEAEAFAKASSFDDWGKQNPNGLDTSGAGTGHAKKQKFNLIPFSEIKLTQHRLTSLRA
jgi:hypothetical protein